MNIRLRNFRFDNGCTAYILADADSKAACIIDPLVDDVESYHEYIENHGLNPELIIDTQTHIDHYSATHTLAEKYGAKIAMSEKTESRRVQSKLTNNREIQIGNLKLRVLLTPGHTEDSLCLLLKGPIQDVLFSGGTLLIGGTGKLNSPDADIAKLKNSLSKIESLDSQTWLMPAHDCFELLFSNLETEKKTNPCFKDEAYLGKALEKDKTQFSKVCEEIRQYNLDQNPDTPIKEGLCSQDPEVFCDSDFAGIERIEAAEYQKNCQDSSCFTVDIREAWELKKIKIPDTTHIPMGELIFHWDRLKSAENVSLYCRSGNRTCFAIKTLYRLGLKHISDLRNGTLGWIGAGLPVEKEK